MDTVNSGVDIAPAPVAPEPVDVVPEAPVPAAALPPEVISDRSFRASKGLPDFKTYDDLYKSISAGQEKTMRDLAANHANNTKEAIRQQFITQLSLARMGGPVPKDQLAVLDGIMKAKVETDPNSVFEEYFARSVLDDLKKAGTERNWWKETNPISADKSLKEGSEYITKDELLKTAGENAEIDYQKQSYIGWAADEFRSALPFYSQYRLSGNVKGAPGAFSPYALLTGDNLEEQAKKFWTLPLAEAKQELYKTLDYLKDDPGLMKRWIAGMRGLSHQEAFIDNVFSAGDLAMLAGPVKSGLSAVRGAVRSSVRAHVNTPRPTPATIAEGAGDIELAGDIRLKERMVHDLTGAGSPVNAAEGLPSIFNGSIDELGRSRANFSQEFTNRLVDRWNETKDAVIGFMTNSVKVDRLKGVDALDAALPVIKAGLKEEGLPGLKNRIADVSVERDPVTLGLKATYYLGDENALPLSSATRAQALAKTSNLGEVVPIQGPTLPRKPSPPIVPGPQPPLPNGGLTVVNKAAGTYKYATKEGAGKVTVRKIKEGPDAGKFTARIETDNGVTAGPSKEGTVFNSPGRFIPFDTREQALEAAGKAVGIGAPKVPKTTQNAPTGSVEATAPVIKQQGAGFYITVIKPVDETKDFIRNARLTLKEETATPNSWVDALVGRGRTPDETLSLAQRENRKAATFGMATYYKVLENTVKEIRDLKAWTQIPFSERRKKWQNWLEIVGESQTKDPTTGKTRIFHKNLQELSNAYLNRFGRSPDEQEAAAYFAYKKAEELGAVWNKFVYNKGLESQGAEKFTLTVLDPRRQTEMGIPTFEKTFNGTAVPHIPQSGETVLFLGSRPGELGARLGGERYRSSVQIKGKLEAQVKADIESGKRTVIRLGGERYRSSIQIKGKLEAQIKADIDSGKRTVIRLAEPGTNPLGSHYVKYAVVETRHIKRSPIDWDFSNVQVKRPIDLDFDHYVKQARVEYDDVSKFHNYLGDTTIGAFNIRGIAKDVTDHLNQIRLLLKNRDFAGAEAFHASSNKLPMEWNTIKEWFQGGVTPSGVPIKPRLSLDEPIQITNKHNMVIEHDKELLNRESLKDRAREGYAQMNAKGDYDRFDQFTLENKGTRDNPLYNVLPVHELDPIATLNRNLSGIINSNFLEDYKRFSIEHWLEEARPFLKASVENLRSSPEYHFYNPKWLEGKEAGENFKTIQSLKTANYQIRQFLGVKNVMDTFLHTGAQALADATYEKSARLALVPRAAFPYVRDPFTFIRSATYDLTMGLFSPATAVLNLASWVNIAGIAGFKYAAPGARAMLLHTWSKINKHPEILDKMDEMATHKIIPGTMGFKPGEWKEANALLVNSGFERSGVEHALRNTLQRDVVASEVDRWFLNPGRGITRATDASNRISAYYTSYLEFRAENPIIKIGNDQAQSILERADILATNMSRASASALNTGVMSIPTQFATYTMRLAEQFTGKRLTQLEKARLFGWNFAVYGISAFGLTGLPLADILKRDAIEFGYVTGMGTPESLNKYMASAVMDGLPSLLNSVITGEHLNIGERLGPYSGINQISDMLRSDKTWIDLLGGAAFSKVRNTIANMDGFTAMLMSGLKQDGAFKPKLEDFTDMFKEVSTVNRSLQLYAAIKSGQLISKNELYLTDISKGSALVQFLSGIQPQSVSDMYAIHMNMKNEKELEKLSVDRFKREFSRGLMALKTNSPEQSQDFFKRAFYWLELPDVAEHKKNEYLREAIKGNESLVNTLNWDYYKPDNVPKRRPMDTLKVLPTALRNNN